MDTAYEGDETRQFALDRGFIPAVLPKNTRLNSWEYGREMYKHRSEVDHLLRYPKYFRRIFS